MLLRAIDRRILSRRYRRTLTSAASKVTQRFRQRGSSCAFVFQDPVSRPNTYRLFSRCSGRLFATPIEPIFSASDDYVPFQDLPSKFHTPSPNPEPGFDLADSQSVDPRRFVIPPQPSYRAPPRFYATRNFLSGDIAELRQSLYACVQVGRLDRAAVLTRRIAALLDSTVPEVYDAHYQYLCGMLESLLQAPSRETFSNMQKWLELEIRGQSVPINSNILAIVIKGALHVLEGAQLDRTVRRYHRYAQDLGPGVDQDTFSSELFTDSEWCRLVRLFPKRFSPPTEHVLVSESPVIANEESPSSSPGDLQGSTPDQRDDINPGLIRIRETDLKGGGLKALRASLSTLNEDVKEQIISLGLSEERAALHRQEQLETGVLDSALRKWREESETTQRIRAQGLASQSLLGAHIHSWVQKMASLLDTKLQKVEAMESSPPHKTREEAELIHAAPFLTFARPEKVCAIILTAYIRGCISPSPRSQSSVDAIPVRIVAKGLGHTLLDEMKATQMLKQATPKISHLSSKQRRQELLRLAKRKSYPIDRNEPASSDLQLSKQILVNEEDLHLPRRVASKIGVVALKMILDVAEIPTPVGRDKDGRMILQDRPIGSHEIQWSRGKMLGVIKTNPELIERLKSEPPAGLIAKHLPMIVQPRKWQSLNIGPYIKTKVPAVRTKDSTKSQQQYLKLADARGDLKQVFAALDVISKVPWRVNQDLFKVMVNVWNSGEKIAKFAPEKPGVTLPPEPEKADRSAYAHWKYIVRSTHNEVTGWHSQRAYQNFQLEVARSLLDDEFYCPHNLDFRGRAYPIPPYFNHMGPDYVRGLFLFAQGKELGEVGLHWLKVQLANVYGYDKESLGERQGFVDNHLNDIYDSANNPLEGKRWWMGAEDPWQCLAACMELRNALDSPVPSKYVSHLPVQQDGSCNGLQHYAALGGDELGAAQVNLEPADRPADIYGAVADSVKSKIANDVAKGDKRAQVLDGKIVRKVVKQTVMTNVYGVTFMGAIQQVRTQLEEIIPRDITTPDMHMGTLAGYVASLIFESLAQMFEGAHAIQKWFGECGGRISQAITPEQIERLRERREAEHSSRRSSKTKAYKRKPTRSEEERMAKDDQQFKSTIVWTTPLGMPVVQPYRTAQVTTLATTLQDLRIMEPSASDPINKRKQLQAFPPNFIHSLDASHMMLSALKCDEVGLSFAAVHDSYWTHAGSVPTLNRILRDCFIRMHCENVIGRLREEFIVRYRNCLNWRPVRRTSGVGKKIEAHLLSKGRSLGKHLKAAKIEHHSQIDDLLEEYERQRLLNSQYPEERERGSHMVTAASIYEEMGDKDEHFLSGHAIINSASSNASTDAVDTVELGDVDQRMTDTRPVDDDEDELEELGLPDKDITLNQDNDPTLAEGTKTSDLEEGKRPVKRRRKPPPHTSDKIYFWMPLKFPLPPRKGSFDVSRLKESTYFFS